MKIIEFLLGYVAFQLGYCIGRRHERQGWVIWLDAKIPRLKGQRPQPTAASKECGNE